MEFQVSYYYCNNFIAVKIDFFESKDELYRLGETPTGSVLPHLRGGFFTRH